MDIRPPLNQTSLGCGPSRLLHPQMLGCTELSASDLLVITWVGTNMILFLQAGKLKHRGTAGCPRLTSEPQSCGGAPGVSPPNLLPCPGHHVTSLQVSLALKNGSRQWGQLNCPGFTSRHKGPVFRSRFGVKVLVAQLCSTF